MASTTPPSTTRRIRCQGDVCFTIDPADHRRVHRTRCGTFGLDVTISSPAPGGSMSAANPQAQGGSTGADSVSVTLESLGSTNSVQGGIMGLGSWTAQFRPGIAAGDYVLTAEARDSQGNLVSESIAVTVS
jgi:hypothetical protein